MFFGRFVGRKCGNIGSGWCELICDESDPAKVRESSTWPVLLGTGFLGEPHCQAESGSLMQPLQTCDFSQMFHDFQFSTANLTEAVGLGCGRNYINLQRLVKMANSCVGYAVQPCKDSFANPDTKIGEIGALRLLNSKGICWLLRDSACCDGCVQKNQPCKEQGVDKVGELKCRTRCASF